jgi:hypothetical protein
VEEKTNTNMGPIIGVLLALILGTGFFSYTGYGMAGERDTGTVQFIREDSVGVVGTSTANRRVFRGGGSNFGK